MCTRLLSPPPPLRLLDGNASACVKVRSHDTFSGRCYSFNFACESAAKATTDISLDLRPLAEEDAGRTRMDLYFHHPSAALGLNGNFWPGASVHVEEIDTDVGCVDFAISLVVRGGWGGEGELKHF